MQAAWHPGSDAHFAVLASDNVFRLYQVDDMSTPVGSHGRAFMFLAAAACIRWPCLVVSYRPFSLSQHMASQQYAFLVC